MVPETFYGTKASLAPELCWYQNCANTRAFPGVRIFLAPVVSTFSISQGARKGLTPPFLSYHPFSRTTSLVPPSLSCHPLSPVALFLLSPSFSCHPLSPVTLFLLSPSFSCHPLSPVTLFLLSPSFSCHPLSPVTLFLLSPSLLLPSSNSIQLRHL